MNSAPQIPDASKIANASGFLFQLAVEHEIKRTRHLHGWDVAVREHPWTNRETREEGFIDLVLIKGNRVAVIECKRPKDGQWVFLVPNEQDQHARARCLWCDWIPEKRDNSGFYDFRITPASPESQFCAIRGQGEDHKSMLERISSQLLSSLDCLAEEERMISNCKKDDLNRIYLPIIITSARLAVCKYDPSKISLDDGCVSDADCSEVNFIRFRKSLTTELSKNARPTTIEQANNDKERTVLILAASAIPDVLRKIEIGKLNTFDRYPWEIARNSSS